MMFMLNSTYSSHWAIICSVFPPKMSEKEKQINLYTTKSREKKRFEYDYYCISTSRFMGVFISECKLKNNFSFIDENYNMEYVIINRYNINDIKNNENKTTIYNIANDLTNYINQHHKGKYSLINHNCHHAVAYIIQKYCSEKIETFSGNALIKNGLKDILTGPKIFI